MFTQISVICQVTGRKAGALKVKGKEFNLGVKRVCENLHVMAEGNPCN